MRRIKCGEARRSMQDPAALDSAARLALEVHLEYCADCRMAGENYRQVDRQIETWLQSRTASISVRESVLEHLTPDRTSPTTSHRMLRRIPVRLGLLLPPALAAFLLMLALPAVAPGRNRGPTTASAAWRLVRPFIGFPLAVDFRRPNHLLAGAGGQVYESWTAGSAWQPLAKLPGGLVIRDLLIDAAEPGHYLVAAKHSVYSSADGGKRWDRALAWEPGSENMLLEQDPASPATFYLGPSILWKSSDSGRTWKRAGNGFIFAPNGIQSLTIAPGGKLYTAIWGGGVAESSNGGATWQRRAAGLRMNVLDVSLAPSGTLWAATDRGVFFSSNAGLHWRRTSLPSTWLATGVLSGDGYTLAAGDHALYRSSDGGRHWQLSMQGLPLDPYIYGLTQDPFHPQRVYASLNSDGIFRSDDGGKTWRAVNSGIPLRSAASGGSANILFARHGALWITDRRAVDPGQLSVDEDVTLAALTPDGASAAYVASTSPGWAVRLLSASSGSGATTVLQGGGAVPRRLLWSPNSAMLAVVRPASITVVTPAGAHRQWPISADTYLVGWTSDGQDLLLWSGGKISVRRWNGAPIRASQVWRGRTNTTYPAPPTIYSGGRDVALVWSGHLLVRQSAGPLRSVAREGQGCAVSSWSPDGSQLLVACRSRTEIRHATGALVGEAGSNAAAVWMPDSGHTLLIYRGDRLFAWSGGRERLLLRRANPVTAS